MKNRKRFIIIGLAIVIILAGILIITHKERGDDYAKIYVELIIETLDESTGGNYEKALENAQNKESKEQRTVALDFSGISILNKEEKSRVIELLKPVWKCNVIEATFFELKSKGKINEEGIYEEGNLFKIKDGWKIWNKFSFEMSSLATGEGGFFMKEYQVSKEDGKWIYRMKNQAIE